MVCNFLLRFKSVFIWFVMFVVWVDVIFIWVLVWFVGIVVYLLCLLGCFLRILIVVVGKGFGGGVVLFEV